MSRAAPATAAAEREHQVGGEQQRGAPVSSSAAIAAAAGGGAGAGRPSSWMTGHLVDAGDHRGSRVARVAGILSVVSERMQTIREMRRRHSAKTKLAKTKLAKTKPAVFILESLDLDDEQDDRCCEGKLLAQFLDMAELPNRYVYVRTQKELRAFLKMFAKSRYRYLHFSCHGNATSVGLTLDDLSVKRLATELSKVAARRRVFLSTCLVTERALARELFRQCPECYSLVGPAAKIGFSDATVFWASFYHLMFREDQKTMKQSDMKNALEKLADIFGVQMNAFLRDEDTEHGFKHSTFGRSRTELAHGPGGDAGLEFAGLAVDQAPLTPERAAARLGM